jgi:hypothetical protein
MAFFSLTGTVTACAATDSVHARQQAHAMIVRFIGLDGLLRGQTYEEKKE